LGQAPRQSRSGYMPTCSTGPMLQRRRRLSALSDSLNRGAVIDWLWLLLGSKVHLRSQARNSNSLIPLMRRGSGAVERGGLENRCPSYGGPRVRIPPSPPAPPAGRSPARATWFERQEGTGGRPPLQTLRLTTRRFDGSPLHFTADLATGTPCVTSRRSLWGGWRRRWHRKVARLQAG